MTALPPVTAFTLIPALKARVCMLESAGAELARSEETWRNRALVAELERDELATRLALLEMAEVEAKTQVDQSARVRMLERENSKLQKRVLLIETELADALGSWQGPLMHAACDAIRCWRVAEASP